MVKYHIKKISSFALLCAALLCSACAQKKENEPEKYWRDYAIVQAMFGLPAESETEQELVLHGNICGMILRENVLAAINREEEPESDSGIWQGTAVEDEYKTGSLPQEGEWLVIPEEVTWNKHAFLLEGEDIFFADMPEHWIGFAQNTGAVIFVPTPGRVSSSMRKEYERLLVYKKNQDLDSLEDFVFADGKVGKKWSVHRYDQKGLGDGQGNMGMHAINIFSADDKYMFRTDWYEGLTNLQYEEYQKYSDRFYESMMFQNAQIGLAQAESLKKRDKVRLHAYLKSLCLDITVPEGIEFHISDLYGDWLILNLDGGYVRVVYNSPAGEIGEDFWDMDRKMLTDETYEEKAAYAVGNRRGEYVYYIYEFIHSQDIYAAIEVPEGDEEMLAVALDIVRSIRFR